MCWWRSGELVSIVCDWWAWLIRTSWVGAGHLDVKIAVWGWALGVGTILLGLIWGRPAPVHLVTQIFSQVRSFIVGYEIIPLGSLKDNFPSFPQPSQWCHLPPSLYRIWPQIGQHTCPFRPPLWPLARSAWVLVSGDELCIVLTPLWCAQFPSLLSFSLCCSALLWWGE